MACNSTIYCKTCELYHTVDSDGLEDPLDNADSASANAASVVIEHSEYFARTGQKPDPSRDSRILYSKPPVNKQ